MSGSRRGGTIRRLSEGRWSGLLALLCALTLTGALAPSASARVGAEASTKAKARHSAPRTVPGSPGVPQTPTTVFSENFENRQSNLPIRLNNYTGVTGMTYTADQPWLENCNGWVAAFSDPAGGQAAVAPQVADCNPQGGPGATGVTAWNNVRQLSRALGILNGTPTPANNHAVSAYTNGHVNNGNPGANFIEFQTGSEIPLPAAQDGRFLTFSVNASETSCDTNHNHAMLDFFLFHGATETPVTNESIDPCSQGTQVSPGFWAGTFPGDAPLLVTDPSVGVMMRNAQGSGNGNDHAFDDIKLLDVTPQLDKTFAPGTVQIGQTSRLTITITNTDDLLAKSGWAFTDTLPAGLVLATPSNAATTCPAGTLSAPDGGNEVSITDGAINAGQASCTVTVDVTSETPSTYHNDATDMTILHGLNPPGGTDVVFTEEPEPSISLQKSADPTTFTTVGQLINYTYLVTNNGSEPLTNVNVADPLPGLSSIDCPVSELQPGENTTCTATYTVTQADLDAGSVSNTGTAHGTPPEGPDVIDTSDVTITSVPSTALHLEKSVDQTSFSAAGETITYRYAVTNTGNVRLNNVTVSDDTVGLTNIPCTPSSLEPGDSAQCTATYVTTQADVDAGSIHNVAIARGTPPGATTPTVSNPGEAVIEAVPAPAITVQKSADPMTFSAVGETITYGYHVTNTGNTTLNDVGVTDAHAGLSAITCGTTTLAPGESTDCTATYVTTEQDVDNGSITDSATSHGTPPGATEPVESPPDEVTIPAASAPSITVEKSAHPTTFTEAGETITYSYHVTNTGNVALSDVGVTDDLAGLSAVTCTATTLAPGASTNCTATYVTTQQDVDAGSIHNTATSHGTTPDGEPVESPPDEATVLATASPSIALVKTGEPTTFTAAGQTITYTYHVTNTGNTTLDDVGITDDLPGLSAVTCTATTLAPGASTNCTATYVTTQQDVNNGSIHNTATSHGTPPGATEPVVSEPSEVIIPAEAIPSLAVEKSAHPTEFTAAGETITYTYFVINNGNVPLTNVGITDPLPGLSAVTCALTTLQPDETTECTGTYVTTQADVDAGSVHNIATSHGTPPGEEPIDSPPSETTIEAVPNPSIAVQKSAQPTTFNAAGQTITYTYHVTNTGNTTLDDVGITDDLPGLSAVTCAHLTLAPGANTNCTATYVTTQQDVNNGSIHNTATSHGIPPGETEPVVSDPSDVTIPGESAPSMVIEKSVHPATFTAPGQTITYTYHVTNTGNVPLHSVGVTDDLAGLSAVTCTATTLAPGATTNCTATYVTTQADVDAGSINNVATAHGTPPTGEPIDSPPDEVTVEAIPTPSIAVQKSAEPTTYSAAGQTITYTYHVTNTGNTTLNDVGVTDELPGLSAITCTATSLAPGASTNCTATYVTTQQDVNNGSIHNTATSHGTPPGATEPVVSEPSETTVEAVPSPSVTVQKTAEPTTFTAVGQTITYTYHVTNTGNTTLNDVGVTDVHPGLSAITCTQVTLEPGESATCTATYVTTQADVDAGSVKNSATAHGTPPGATEPVESPPSEVVVQGKAKASIRIRKSVHPKHFWREGQHLHFRYRVTNTGNVTLTNVRVIDDLRGLSRIECPRRTLAPGESMTCEATYRIRDRDMWEKCVRNRAIAEGLPPGTHTPVRSRPSHAIAFGHIPVTG
ncbi:DUF7507 domain-containing protein [Actinomadura harenae]|uniref:DUF11 domain-containing protein n=1 Tax=Actinomadura harenae TaxID=2483351 RepID=A0A3M2MFQ7_9ACTN|nr:DUF11 domain-containing protein [Actinomadura harenae]RMI47820.1 DUF11 domain-containing protein [Actinomadura harenae]